MWSQKPKTIQIWLMPPSFVIWVIIEPTIYKQKLMIICEHNYRIFCCCICTLNDIMLIYVQPVNTFTTRLND